MAQTAAHLVDRVFPDVCVRQWVLTLPYPLRCRLAWEPSLCKEVLACFTMEVHAFYAQQVSVTARTGSVTVVQFCGQDLRLNVHFHTLVVEGAYDWDEASETLVFQPLPPPRTAEVQQLVDAIAQRVEGLLRARGLLDEDGDAQEEDPDDALRLLQGLSADGRALSGPRAGRKPRHLRGSPRQGRTRRLPPRTAQRGYFNLHADTSVAPRDREARERLCRYVARPPVSNERLSQDQQGNVVLSFKRAWDDGTNAVVLDPHTFLARLSALVAPPGFNRTRYHGVFAPNHAWRADVVPLPPPASPDAACGDEAPPVRLGGCKVQERTAQAGGPVRWTPWAQLLQRVLGVDGSACPRCGWRMHLHAVVMGRALSRVLAGLEAAHGARAPPSAA